MRNLKILFITLCFCLSLGLAESYISENSLLFSMYKSSPVLTFSKNNTKSSHEQINNFIDTYQIIEIKPWLVSATDRDYDGDIYLNRIYRITFSENTKRLIPNAINDLKKLDGIQHIERDKIHRPLYTPNDSQYNQQWFLSDINSNDAWDFWNINGGEIPGNKQIILASVDTGVNWKHPDLVNNVYQNLGEDADGDGQTIVYSGGQWILDPGDLNGIDDDNWDNNASTYIDDLIGWDVSGSDYGDNNAIPPSSWGWSHGTHVAGLLSATTNNNTGIASTAFNCSILPVKSSSDTETITDGYAGLLYAAQAGYHSEGFVIINCSWGRGGGADLFEQATTNNVYNNYNAVIFAGAGNDPVDEAFFPASYNNVISVTALGQNGAFNGWATRHESVDLGAPGESIRSTTMTNYSSWDGTSMASPVAASCAGLLKSFNMDWNNKMVHTMILATADPMIYNVNPQNTYAGKLGKGRVDMLKAISTPLFPKLEIAGEDITIINDNDGSINIGESVEYNIVVFNDPDWGMATNAQLTLSTTVPGVTFSNNNVSLGNIAAGDAGLNPIPITINFSSSCPTGDVEFVANISSNADGYVKYEVNLPFVLNVNDVEINYGDITNDGVINVLDIVTIVNIILDTTTPTAYEEIASDLNQDSIINVQDIVLLINLVLSD